MWYRDLLKAKFELSETQVDEVTVIFDSTFKEWPEQLKNRFLLNIEERIDKTILDLIANWVKDNTAIL